MSLAERLARSERPDRIAEVRDRVQAGLIEALGPRLYDPAMSDGLEDVVHPRVRQLIDAETVPLTGQEKMLIIQQIGDAVLGLGPLEAFMRDPEIDEIMVNNAD